MSARAARNLCSSVCAAFPHLIPAINHFGMGDVNGATKRAFQPFAVAVSLIEGRPFARDESVDGVVHLALSRARRHSSRAVETRRRGGAHRAAHRRDAVMFQNWGRSC